MLCRKECKKMFNDRFKINLKSEIVLRKMNYMQFKFGFFQINIDGWSVCYFQASF